MKQRYYQVGGVKVCWHAIIRYLERFQGKLELINKARSVKVDATDYEIVKILESRYGVNSEKLCDEIVTDKLWQLLFMANMMDGVYQYGEDHRVILANKHIVTLTNKMPSIHERRRKNRRKRG